MSQKNLIGIIYVSSIVLLWGTLGSLIDFPLLQSNIYSPGSFGQYLTFSITGLIFTVIGIYLFPMISKLQNDKNE